MSDQKNRSSDSDPGPSDAQTDTPTAEPSERRPRRGPPPNPLYHPLFLPVLLVGFMLWFFWDGFLTTDPDMLPHQTFNRVSFVVTLLFCLRVVPRGIREFRQDRDTANQTASANEEQRASKDQ